MRRVLAATAMVLGTLAGCHLVGGLDGLAVDPEEGAGASGGTPTGAVGPGGSGGATSSSSSGPGGMGGSGPPPCEDGPCSMASTDCTDCLCDLGVCDCDPVTDAPCTAATGPGVCFSGVCVECFNNSHCVDGTCDTVANLCVSADCSDFAQNGNETAIDCGGPDCLPCGNGLGCNAATDCESGYCNGMGFCSACTGDSDCGGSRYCDGGQCFDKLGLFGDCFEGIIPNANRCLSGYCCPTGCSLSCYSGLCDCE